MCRRCLAIIISVFNNNVLKLLLLPDLQAIHCRSAATLETVTKYHSRKYSEVVAVFILFSRPSVERGAGTTHSESSARKSQSRNQPMLGNGFSHVYFYSLFFLSNDKLLLAS
jgi:hypothetical protein